MKPSGADRARHNARHTGAARLIMAEIKRAGEPLSVYKLSLATGMDQAKVRGAINGIMTGSAGGLMAFPGIRGTRRYGFPSMAPKKEKPAPSGPYAIAGPITYPQYVYGASRLTW